MLSKPLLNRIARDESLVRGLADPEARVLIEWLVDRADLLGDCADESHPVAVQHLCLRARAISRFVYLWCHERSPGPAIQLAAVERFRWPLPTDSIDPCLLMEEILGWEDECMDGRGRVNGAT
jgi:hypothetical protein